MVKKYLEIDYTKKYGRLTPIKEARYLYGKDNKKTDRGVMCKCDCGKEKIVKMRYIIAGQALSCGCYALDVRTEIHKNQITHGYTTGKWKDGKPVNKLNTTYSAWVAMKQGCVDSGGRAYAIKPTMIKRWDKFENFLEDMGDRPTGERIILTRHDMSKPYDKENAVWQENKEAQKKRRLPITKKQHELADKIGLSFTKVRSRCETGWTPEEIEQAVAMGVTHRKQVRHPISKYKEEALEYETRNQQIKFYREQGCTLQSIGEEYNLTRERIRQIYNM